MPMRIDFTSTPSADDRAAILKPLRAHNHAAAGDPKAETFALLVRDEITNEVTGGLYGEFFYRWLYIELLAVPEQARGEGIGSRLMEMAEALAREKSCEGIWLDTFDFQAPDFYKRLGFTEFGRLDDFPPRHQRFYLHKRLA